MLHVVFRLRLTSFPGTQEPCKQPSVQSQVAPKHHAGCCSHEDGAVVSLRFLNCNSIDAQRLKENIQSAASNKKVVVLQCRGKCSDHEPEVAPDYGCDVYKTDMSATIEVLMKGMYLHPP